MTTPRNDEPFASSWDRYAQRALDAGQEWPGDEWGDETLWRAWFDRLFAAHGVSEWRRAVEVGQGTGKYTRLVLEASACEVLCCDVSQTFLDLCAQRLKTHHEANRLHLACIEGRDPDAMRNATDRLGWLGTADAAYSIDALVHLPFTTVANTMLSATEILREGGRFITSFAHGLTEAGFAKLVGDIDRTIRAGGHPETGCFHWISPELIHTTATRMGYEVDVCDADPAHHRDGHFVARLVDPDLASRARALRQREP